jgi:hypothetical protein
MELEVQKYLRSGRTPEALKEDYGIDFRRHSRYPKLVTFKYDQIDSHHHRAQKIVRECRGLILDEKMHWKVVAYPFERFFNFGDGFADKIEWDTACVQEKLDGSIMILYHHRDDWHVASSGTPDAGGNVGIADIITFKDLFWNTFGEQIGWRWLQRMLVRLPKDVTFMFELCTAENRVVVRHSDSKVVLLGARNRVTGQELRPGEVIHLFPNTPLPKVYPVGSPKEAIELLDEMKGEEQEGFVCVDGNFNRIKMKCPSYVALHHLADNLLSMRLIMQNVVLKEETAEVAAVFPEHEELLWEADRRYHELLDELNDLYESCMDIEDQKEFALKVKDCKCSGALFALRSGKVPSIEVFIRNNWHIQNLLKALKYK